jgi:hypothetical protein
MKLSTRPRILAGIITTGALIVGGMMFAVPANAAVPTSAPPAVNVAATPDSGSTMAPGVTVTTDNGHIVVSQNGVSVSTVNGATIASFNGKVVASLSAAQTVDLNALSAGISTTKHDFDANAAAQAGASKQSIADVATVLAAGGWTITGAAPSVAASPMAVAAAASCAGYNGSHGYYFPWGSQYGFNSCNTNKLIADVGLGSAGGGVILAALALGGVASGGVSTLIAAVLALGIAGLVACQANSSNGAIWLNVGGSVGVLGMSCWGQ